MRFLVALLLFAAPLAAQPGCPPFTVSKATVSLPATASTSNSITVTAPPSDVFLPCDQRWVVQQSQVAWMTVSQAYTQVQTGTGTFTFSATANPYCFTRTADLTVTTLQGPLAVTVTQASVPGSVGPIPNSIGFTAAGGTGSIFVQANCSWAATTATPWIALPSSSGIDPATVQFTVQPNGCFASRAGSISVSGTSLTVPLVTTVNQDGSPSNFTLSATSAAVVATANDNRFTVTTGPGCAWSASSDVTWMTLISGASGSGSGAVGYHVLANAGAARTGSIHVNTSPTTQLQFTVTQQAAAPPTPVLSSVDNAASYATDAVSPGEIVTLFGQNMGPTPLVPLQIVNGALTTTLGGTQVLFDGVAAPMIYSLQGQVSAVAPYGLAGKTSTQVQVKYNGAVSNTVTMPVQPSTPAIFSLDSSGLGPGAILNQDFSINSSALPAARGSVVSIYCTGGGATNPATADGAVVGATLPQLTLPTTVTIGGLNATVSYAGGVPSSIAGLTQINAQVPAGVTPGTKIPVVVKIGDATSISGVTMAVN